MNILAKANALVKINNFYIKDCPKYCEKCSGPKDSDCNTCASSSYASTNSKIKNKCMLIWKYKKIVKNWIKK